MDRQFLEDLAKVVPSTAFASNWEKENERAIDGFRVERSNLESDACFNIKETDVFSDASKGATALRGLMTSNGGVIPEGIQVTEQQRRRLEASSYGPWKRAPNTSTNAPNADSLVAKSLLNARPSVFAPPASTNPDLTELHWDEEGPNAHWPIDDDTVFYKMSKIDSNDRRDTSTGGSRKNKCFDLNIVMPLVIPGAEIRVLNSDGENYYNLADSNPGAHILFGRKPAATATTTTTTTVNDKKISQDNNGDITSETAASSSGVTSSPLAKLQTIDNETILVSDDPTRFAVANPPPIKSNTNEDEEYPSACDIWASFLHVHLGVIRNCRPDQISEICSMFSAAFSDELARFMVPVTVDARGIFPSNTFSRSQKQSFDKYETHATFLADNDRKRFRIIRRRLKKFVLLLWERFGVISEGPKFDIALTDNCRTGPRSFFKIEIHRYGQLTHPGLLEHLQRHQDTTTTSERATPSSAREPIFEAQNCPAVVVQSRAVFNELRLEMTHARTVDPRWPEQWVLARRMPAVQTGHSKTVTLARHVFCDRVDMPRIIYEFDRPRQTLLQSRFAPLYLLAEVSQKQTDGSSNYQQKSGIEQSVDIDKENYDPSMGSSGHRGNPLSGSLGSGFMSGMSPFGTNLDINGSKLSATAVPFFPLSTVMSRLTSGTTAAAATVGGHQQHAGGSQPRQNNKNNGTTAQRSAWDRLVTSAGLSAHGAGGTGSDFDSLPSSSFFSLNVAATTAAENLGDREGATLIAKLFQPPLGATTSDLTSNMSPNVTAQGGGVLNRSSPSSNIELSGRFGAAGSSPLLKLISHDEDIIRPITREPCKFYASGDCMRGENCYFLHPADPKLMTTKSDIRHLSPVNPLYF